MFGYITVNKPELKFKEFDLYKAYYCGFCRDLKELGGLPAQATLSYDLTFLIMLLTGLYEPEDVVSECKCAAHPFEKHPTRRNEYSKYAAEMNVLLAYYKCLDDWMDEKKVGRKIFSETLKKNVRRIESKYPEKARVLKEGLEEIHGIEAKNSTDVDEAAGVFGRIFAEIFCYREDAWAPTLRQLGFFLGKYIYLLDAYDDIEKDIKKNNYNPFRQLWEQHPEDFDQICGQILTMMIAECTKNFELLPIITHGEILRNILYAGVWTKYNMITEKRKEEKAKATASSEK